MSEFVIIKNAKGGETALRIANILFVRDEAVGTVVVHRAHDDPSRSDQIQYIDSAMPARLVVAAIELARG